MRRKMFLSAVALMFVPPFGAVSQTVSSAPTPASASAPTVVPQLVPYSGIALNAEGKPISGQSSITFLIYKDETGGEPLFTETQTVSFDPDGHYKVQLGAVSANGLPVEIFATGEARWLDAQVEGEAPQPRILLASVPYAMKAADAATLGGLPASAFALAGQSLRPAIAPGGITPDGVTNVTTTGGTAGYIPEFNGESTIVDSPIFISGSNVGIGLTTPTVPFEVTGNTVLNGTMTVNGDSTYNGGLALPPPGTATASTSYNSHLLKIETSAWNSSTASAVSPRFEWVAEVAGNNTATPTATLNLQSSTTTATPTETGFHFNADGTMQFAPGQTFPGTGAGTITGVTAGTALTGGGTTGNVTLNLDTTKVPELAASNSFTNTQTITGGDLNLPATTGATSGVLNIGGVPFLHGYRNGNFNVFVGGAGNFTTSANSTTAIGYSALASNAGGYGNTAAGFDALTSNTGGYGNTATGYMALAVNTSGDLNAAIGAFALQNNRSGSSNTGLGYAAGPDSGSPDLSNATTIGYGSSVSQSNTLVLGQTTAGNPGASFVNVGIGTATPRSILEATVAASGALGPALTLTNRAIGASTAAAVDFNTYPPSSMGTYNPTARIEAVDDGSYSSNLFFYANIPGGANNGLQQNMVIKSNGQAGIGITPGGPGYQFMVEGSTGNSGIYGLGSTSSTASGFTGVVGYGGDSGGSDDGGTGGFFHGGDNSAATGGYGIQAYPGNQSSGTLGPAAYLAGNVEVAGTLTASVKDFKIDDPVDPANKYLYHASVESSEMMNIYSGNATTDELGLATIQLPEWFEAENGDFRYQLTVIGGRFAQAIVSKEIANHQFTISTNASDVKVSWQVTAIRQDAYARANPLVVEQEKPAKERGFYIHPKLYGQPEEKQTAWGRNPQQMQQLKAMREQRKSEAAKLLSHDQPASAVNRPFTPQTKPAVEAPKP